MAQKNAKNPQVQKNTLKNQNYTVQKNSVVSVVA